MTARKTRTEKPPAGKKTAGTSTSKPTSKRTSAVKAERVQSRLTGMPGWSFDKQNNVITRTYAFPTFMASIRFVDWVAELAEAADHHPDLDVRYDKVKVALSTHSAGGITSKDFDLARLIDHL